MRALLHIIVLSTLLPVSLNTYATDNDISFVTSVGVGHNTLEFMSPGTAGATQGGDFYVIDLAETLIYNSFYVSAAVIISLDDDSFYNASPPSFGNGVTYVDREDFSITAGYSASDWITIYIGNSVGKTRFTSVTSNGFGYVADHDDSGLFTGLTVSTNIMDGTIGFDIAYASFDGEVHTQTPDPAQPVLGDRTLFGDTTGFSYGVHWTATGKDGRTYYVKLKIREYEFEADSSSNNPQPVGVKIDKDFLMISAGLVF